MTTTATGTFELRDWAQEVLDEQPHAQLGGASAGKTFHGDLDATSRLRMLTVGLPDEAGEFQGRAYVAVEAISGTLHGRAGGFAVVHHADLTSGMAVTVVAGSGSGELAGLRGEITIDRAADGSHSYTFDYELG